MFSRSSRRFLLRFNIMWRLMSTTQEKGSENRRVSHLRFRNCFKTTFLLLIVNSGRGVTQPTRSVQWQPGWDFPFVTLHCKPLRQQLWTARSQTWSVSPVRLYAVEPFFVGGSKLKGRTLRSRPAQYAEKQIIKGHLFCYFLMRYYCHMKTCCSIYRVISYYSIPWFHSVLLSSVTKVENRDCAYSQR